MVTHRLVRSSSPALAGLEWPVFEASGASDRPRACMLAGVHGCEYSSIAAVVAFMRALDVSELLGSIVAVPIVSPTSFWARSPFVVPEDGRNLNRAFPGDPNGSFTDVLAHHVFSEFVTGSDVLIDLHGGDMVEALEPFALYDDSGVRQRSERLARAFGLRYVVCDTTDTLGGTTSAAAAAAGIASFIAEAGGPGLLERTEVERHGRGLRRALRPCPPATRTRLCKASSWSSAFCGCARLPAAGGSRLSRSGRSSRPASASVPCSTDSAK